MVCILILLSSQLFIHQKCDICPWYKLCLLYQLFHCCLVTIEGGVRWGCMRKLKITRVQLFPNHLKFLISLTGICFGYYFPTPEIFYPSAYTGWHLSPIFLFSIKIKFCHYFLLILCIANSASLEESKFTGTEVFLRKYHLQSLCSWKA